MWIVNIALRRPLTFIVAAILILLATPFVLLRMPTDIFPEIDIPVVSIIWSYNGLDATDMAQRIVTVSERSLTTTVNDIDHIESSSLAGVGVIKLYLRPGASVPMAVAQAVANVQQTLRVLPPGITAPLVIKYSASSVPIIQLGLSSDTLSEQQLNDLGMNFLRPQLVTIPGTAVPYPYGGKSRVIAVDLDTQALLAKGMTPTDVVNAVTAQNLILPSGTAKLGATEYQVDVNGAPEAISELNAIPVSTKNGSTTYLSEVAHVRDGFSPQTSVVRQDGHRGVLQPILKNGGSSTLQIVSDLRKMLPLAAASLPKDLRITPLFDQSVFVKSAITGVIREAAIAAALTAAMILMFLGSWRSTVIIAVSIPLSILSSIIMLSICGQTINLMTLGGLALAVGILVDDATVTIENIERHLHLGTPLEDAILTGAGEIAVPALVSTLCICIVFVPMFFLSGVAKFLFVPLAEAVVFAMIASYVLSRTLVPTLVKYLMANVSHHAANPTPNLFHRVQGRFEAGFERLRAGYVEVLEVVLSNRTLFVSIFLGICIASCGLFLTLGRDFFPSVDSGQIRLHMRGPTGMRIEETARLADEVEGTIRQVIPAGDLDTILDNIGLPVSGINLAYSNGGTIGNSDAEILIALKEGKHGNTRDYVRTLRTELAKKYPGAEFFFQPADMVTQILNFGSPAAIDVQFAGNDPEKLRSIANNLSYQMRKIPGAVDVHVYQLDNNPGLGLRMNRTEIQQVGLNATDVAENMLDSLSGSFQTSPSFWLSKNGVVYNVAVQSPQYRINTLDDLLRTPVAHVGSGYPSQLLGNLVQVKPEIQPAVVTHYNIMPTVDIYADVDGRDLGSVSGQIQTLIKQVQPTLPRGARVTLRGQVQTMNSSFLALGVGLVMAILLVYLLIVINFQTWVDAFIIITALPAALAGIAWMLFFTETTLSVPALMGAIMTMGVATANSILLVSFARERMAAGCDALTAAYEAGATRIRPVLMTALAMIIGMIPMALGMGDGGEQNAPLGRAVIGGLLFATFSTLLFVPSVFALLHRKRPQHIAEAPALGE
ncbi:efflux RND transporter permease subunit [Paraburkholderia phenazinium]|uniref:Multidrug efflux pump subunit AcrB n=1 Tax=Paraburkholderia phenazinium TaxID=60549 RepID=A0A1N6JQJ6_9BURK|nr:efflux RND transporter permease subunit [Paraburkholderia phenazinium]SIO46437.1 Multidrug efflux pump subunit AcrB [Paraburkholderia phenazinium]